MTTAYAAGSKSQSTHQAVGANCLFHIVGTSRRITTAALQADHDLQGGEDNAVRPDEKDDKRLHEPPSMAKFLKKATCYRKKQRDTF